ncbi:thermonuclease family protein [Paralcaligenes sp. KSB-10]|jgi:endonuclease YncB( thermonuclease family)|uniref:thermonuclease family protein n=1 Tax=Paralcaligenes sp. KSB-10 TaxID=2901142 RepID=UPI001E5401DA|nr:thermonuclease family protein [Paralcaligenes sp. KSB-10]UHL66014.1 thermonuclease family protein [Paralcaligenes sp. KSB-10]
MNSFLNILVRRLVTMAFSNRRSKMLTFIMAVILAALGTFNILNKPAATARPVQHEAPGENYALTGRVVRVADGDTFTLLVDGRQQRIRMASIDAPETTKDSQQPGQPMAQASKKSLADMIAGQTLSLICFEHDQFGRNVCDVPLGDGSTANQKQVAAGMAWANMEGRGKYMRDAKIPELEQHARQAKLGLWQEPNPIRPWVWRYQCWKKGQC